ncbi:MAG: hypothetical protein QOC77_854 [Thermoleophilaceae bacterium]|nr:hypothetical protein [Thermoleophilaceae bacterium]
MTRAPGDEGIAAWRYRTGTTLIALGGVVYVWASIQSSDALFAVAIGLVGCGLLVHVSDPVVYRHRVAAPALLLAAAAAFADAALTATHSGGAGSAVALVVLIGGVAVAAWSRREA